MGMVAVAGVFPGKVSNHKLRLYFYEDVWMAHPPKFCPTVSWRYAAQATTTTHLPRVRKADLGAIQKITHCALRPSPDFVSCSGVTEGYPCSQVLASSQQQKKNGEGKPIHTVVSWHDNIIAIIYEVVTQLGCLRFYFSSGWRESLGTRLTGG